jgi:L-lactate dehydrogenase complex protein LldF
MSPAHQPLGAMLHPELRAEGDPDAIIRDGRRLDHAEGASKPLRTRPEPQPRGAKIHGNRPIDQQEAAARFIAAPEHEKMHDERLWDLRQSATVRCTASPNGRSSARSPRRSRSTR